MSKLPGLSQISHCKSIESLQRALDQTYHYLLAAAKADWQRLFADKDPSDSCVTVRISAEDMVDELAGIPRAGVVPIRPPKPINGKVRRRLA